MPIGTLGLPTILGRAIRMPFTAVLGCMGVRGGLAPLRTILTDLLTLVRPCSIFPTMGFLYLGLPSDWISQLALLVILSFLRRCSRHTFSI